MIVSVNPEPHRTEFDTLLASTIATLNIRAADTAQQLEGLTGRNLEPYVRDVMAELAVDTAFEDSIELIGGQRFPDIIANKFYGVEVKTTTQNHWKTTGNSVLETTRVDQVERIFMLFAKLADPIEFRARPYEEVLSEVVVTHSPRYLIDMNLEPGQTIFDKINLSYDELRNSGNPIRPIIDYYKSKLKPGEELWWMDGDQSKSSNIVIRVWNTLSGFEKQRIRNNAMVFFPEIFSNKSIKYERLPVWLVNNESVVCKNIRDLFTAGGQDSYVIAGYAYHAIPRIFLNLFDNLSNILETLVRTPAIDLSHYWQIETTEKSKLADWIDLVDENAKTMQAVKHLEIKKMLNDLIKIN